MMLTREQEELLLNPLPGTAAARAREFGIDLTLNLHHLRLSLEERLSRLESFAREIEELRKGVRRRPVQ
jgi:hypothetical protein